MAKKALIERELKRDNLVAKYAKKHAELKSISNDAKKSDDERMAARLALQKLPRNANPTRQRNRCSITGRPRGTFQHFGLARAKIREMAFAGAPAAAALRMVRRRAAGEAVVVLPGRQACRLRVGYAARAHRLAVVEPAFGVEAAGDDTPMRLLEVRSVSGGGHGWSLVGNGTVIVGRRRAGGNVRRSCRGS